MRLLAVFAVCSGCVFGEVPSEAVSLAMVVPPETEAIKFQIYSDASCEPSGYHSGGEALRDEARFPVGAQVGISIEVGTYAFEGIAVNSDDVEIAAGCTLATIASGEDNVVRVMLVPVP